MMILVRTGFFCILVWMFRQGNHGWHNAYMQRDETVAHRLAVSTSWCPCAYYNVHRRTVIIKSKDSSSWERKQNLILYCNLAQWWGRLTRTNAMHMVGLDVRTLITIFNSALTKTNLMWCDAMQCM